MATDLAALDEAIVLLREGRPVVVGSRRHGRSVVQGYAVPLRRLGAIAFNRAVRDLVGGIADTQCGFKLFTREAAEAVFPHVTVDGWAFDIEALVIARRRGLRIHELPIEWHYRAQSQVSPVRDSFLMARDVMRVRMNALRGRYD